MTENAGGKKGAGDSSAPVDRPWPLDRPAIVRDLRQKPEAGATPEEIERRWANATELGRMRGLICTGSPSQPECDEPAALAFVLDAVLWSAPCRAHAAEILRFIMESGHGSCRQVPLIEMLEVHVDTFVTSVQHIREQNRQHGIGFTQRTHRHGHKGSPRA